MSFAVALSARAQQLGARTLAACEDEHAEGASDAVRAAVEEALLRGETHYTDRPGSLPLRELIAEQLRLRFGIAVDACAAVLISCGVEEARFVACQQLLRAGACVGGLMHLERLSGAAQLRGARLATGDDKPDLLYLASSAPEPVLREVLAHCPAEAAILYEVDEHACGFHPAQVVGFAARTTTIGPLGAPSWRAGYLLSPPELSPAMRDFKQALTICSTNLSQWAMLAAMREGEARI